MVKFSAFTFNQAAVPELIICHCQELRFLSVLFPRGGWGSWGGGGGGGGQEGAGGGVILIDLRVREGVFGNASF